MELLPGRLEQLSKLNWEDRMIQLAIGFLAGNVFDWGAKEVALLMEESSLDFEVALSFIGPRPWLMDSLDEWLDRLRGEAHRCEIHKNAALFLRAANYYIIDYLSKRCQRRCLSLPPSPCLPQVRGNLHRQQRRRRHLGGAAFRRRAVEEGDRGATLR
jgi:hypothetical protein